MNRDIEDSISRHLQALAVEIGSRPTGSEANRRAGEYIVGALTAAGCEVEQQAFDCLDWQPLGAELSLDDEALPVQANPFTPSCRVSAPMAAVGNLAELEAADLAGKIVVLHGELTAGPLFPRHFPFFTVDEHVHIIETLEAGRPAAVIAVSSGDRNPAPVIEDGDFALPSVTIPASAGQILLAHPGAVAELNVRSLVRPAVGANIIGRKAGAGSRRLVVCAHFDTKPGTPGALDNAAGVAAMLALAETLPGQMQSLEFVAFNGEDYYAAPGEVVYLRRAGESLHEISLAINIDGAGLEGTGNTIALFDPPPRLAEQIRETLAHHPYMSEVEPWPQGDHTIFWQKGVPAVALTSAGVVGLVDEIIHTEKDTVDRVSAGSLGEVVAFVRDIIRAQAQP